MRISVKRSDGAGRLQLDVLTASEPWRVSMSGRSDEALLDPRPGAIGFLAEGYPDWLGELCERIDADRMLAESIVAEVQRRRR